MKVGRARVKANEYTSQPMKNFGFHPRIDNNDVKTGTIEAVLSWLNACVAKRLDLIDSCSIIRESVPVQTQKAVSPAIAFPPQLTTRLKPMSIARAWVIVNLFPSITRELKTSKSGSKHSGGDQ